MKWLLVILVVQHYFTGQPQVKSVTTTPFETEELCKEAAKAIRHRNVKTLCLPQGENP